MTAIELAKCTDMKNIYLIGKDSLPIYYSKKNIVEFIINNKTIVLKATIDNIIAGYVIGNQKDDTNFHINTFAVDQLYRRRGIGKDLIVNLIKRATRDSFNEITNITLFVQTTNDAAISLYKSLKFEIDKEIKDYYWDGEHSYLMKFIVAK